jgi:hypothetical protein
MDGTCRPKWIKETIMFSTKTLLAAASLAVLTAVGLGSASAAPWDHRGYDRHDRFDRHHSRYDRHHGYVSRMHIHRALRPYRFTVVSDPFFLRGRYVVRTHDRFGRTMLVQIDPWSGAFIRRL